MQPPESMLEQRERQRVLPGVLILFALLALAVLIVSLDEILARGTETVAYAAFLPESEGLGAGAPVWIAGSEAGEVLSVQLLPPHSPDDAERILALVSIRADLARMIRRDSRAHLTSDGLMGDPVLQLSVGDSALPRLSPGDTIAAAYGPDRGDVALANARLLLAETDSLLDQAATVSALYRERRPALDALQRSLRSALAEFDRTRSTLATSPLSALLEQDPAGRVERLRASLLALGDGLRRYGEGPLGDEADRLRARAASLEAEIARLDSALSSPAGFIGRQASDSALGREAAAAGAQLDSLVAEALANPLMFF